MSRKVFEIGGIVAAVVLIAFGVAAIVMGSNGRSTVHTELVAQKITGTPDMTPAAITAEAQKAGLNTASIPIPTCSVAKKAITSGADARCFAQYMNIHALEATGGQVYSQMGMYLDKSGKPTEDKAAAALDPKTGAPVQNPARAIWINETALGGALNASYMADQISLFGIVVGIALLLAGLGFGVLSIGGALRSSDSALKELAGRRAPKVKSTPVAGH